MTKSLSLIAAMIASVRKQSVPETHATTVTTVLETASLSAAELQAGYVQLRQEMSEEAALKGFEGSSTYIALGNMHDVLAKKAKDIHYVLDERGLRHMEADNQLSLDTISEREKSLDPAIIADTKRGMNGAADRHVGETM